MLTTLLRAPSMLQIVWNDCAIYMYMMIIISNLLESLPTLLHHHVAQLACRIPASSVGLLRAVSARTVRAAVGSFSALSENFLL